MEQHSYIRAVIKKLKCSGAKKKEIEKQLQSDIGIALEEGRALSEILQEMGSPSDLAAEFNENMPEEERKKAHRAKVGKIAAVIVVLLLAAGVFGYWWLPKIREVKEDSRFEKTTVTQQVQTVIALMDEGDYDTLSEEYATTQMAEYLNADYMDAIKAQLAADWGARVSFGNAYMAEISQQGQDYVVVEMTVTYENISVIYKITLDEDLKVAGLYIR